MKNASGIAASILVIGVAGFALAGDENDIAKSFDLTGFDRIEIAGVYDLDIEVGPDFLIALSGPAYEMNRVKVSVKNGVLNLEQRKRERGEKRRHKRDGVDAVITLPGLLSLDVSGVVDGRIAGVDTDKFEIGISGVGEMELAGECGTLKADISGVGELDAKDLKCRVVSVQVSGVGEASVFASEEVDARVSGMGAIDIFGSPERVHKSGGMFSDITIR